MPLEIELKFPVDGFSALRRSLTEAGAVPDPVVFEQNIVYDMPPEAALPGAPGPLRAAGVLLRLRRNVAKGRESRAGVLTVKLPAPADAPQGFKVRREIETEVADFAAMQGIVAGLGYVETLRYEKVRETWSGPGVHICLDRLPFGRFVEIEGQPQDIAAWAARLGLDPAASAAATYHDLHLERCRRLGAPHTDSFVFDPGTADRLLAAPCLDD